MRKNKAEGRGKNIKKSLKRKGTVLDKALSLEFDYEKNQGKHPEDYTMGSGARLWWKCDKGHSWDAVVHNRANGSGCPFCAGKRPVVGVNDLATVNPSLASEFDCEKNKGIDVTQLTAFSNKKIWWRCARNHSWQAMVNSRTRGNGCPYCADKRPIVGINDLQTVNPKLASEFDSEKNGSLRVENLTYGSKRSIWWRCGKGHSWRASVSNRNKGRDCPYCSGRLAIIGVNDLKTVNPVLAAEFDIEKNTAVNIEELKANSGKKVIWRCKKGHNWAATVCNRSKGYGCPYCFGRLAVTGVNDLATVNPELAAEFDVEENKGINLKTLSSHARKKVAWKCNKGHKWVASVYSRSYGNGCPYCSGYYAIPGVTDLGTLFPDVAKEFDVLENKGINISDLCPNSGKKVKWKCEYGHSWVAKVYSRVSGNRCPKCSKLINYSDKEIPNEESLVE